MDFYALSHSYVTTHDKMDVKEQKGLVTDVPP